MPIVYDATTSATVVFLNDVWLNAATDPTDATSFNMVGDAIKVESSVQVTAQQMAGGRVRLVTKPGKTWSTGLTFYHCTPEQTAWLDAHQGQIVCFRDHQGTKFFGFYSQVPVSESTSYRDQGDVELSITSCTFSQAV